MENIILQPNDDALEWVHDFLGSPQITELDPTCSSTRDYLCLFEHYCSFTWSDERMWLRLLQTQNVNNFIEKVLHEEQPYNSPDGGKHWNNVKRKKRRLTQDVGRQKGPA